MKLRTLSALLGLLAALSSASCASVTKWNAAQITEIRKRAAFAMSCDAEDVEIIEVDRDTHGRVRTLRAVGCARKATYVMARDASAAPSWTLDAGRLSARN
jgi:hypothetical protein